MSKGTTALWAQDASLYMLMGDCKAELGKGDASGYTNFGQSSNSDCKTLCSAHF